MVDSFSPIQNALYERLIKIYDNVEFIMAVFSYLPTEKEQKRLIRLIDNSPGVTDTHIIDYAIAVYKSNHSSL